jgi:hypothetical protein
MDIDDESTVEFNDSFGASLDLNRHSCCDPIPKTSHIRSCTFNGNESTDSFMLEDSFACGESFSCDDAVGGFLQSPPRRVFRPRLDLTTVIDFEEDNDETESLPEIKEGDFDDEDDSDNEDKNDDDNDLERDEHRYSVRELETRAEVLSLSDGFGKSRTPVDAQGY